jgi:hypothetical protein
VRLDLALELARIGERVAVQLFAHGVQNFARWLDAEVGREQRGFKLLEKRRIDLALAQKNVLNGLGERSLRLADRSLQPFEQRRLDPFRFSKERNHTVERRARGAFEIVAEAPGASPPPGCERVHRGTEAFVSVGIKL